jgi:hypothetical protein
VSAGYDRDMTPTSLVALPISRTCAGPDIFDEEVGPPQKVCSGLLRALKANA